MNPDNTVFDAKRLIGRRFDDPSVQSDMKLWPFNLINDGGKPKIRVEYKSEQKTFFPEEISSMVLVKMKEIAEAYLGKVCIVSDHVYIQYYVFFQLGDILILLFGKLFSTRCNKMVINLVKQCFDN